MNPQVGAIPTLLEDTEVALEKLAHQEVQLVKEAEELFKCQVEHIKQIDKLRQHIPNMEKIDVELKRLGSLVDSSFTLVEEVCGRFRRIDLAKARVDDCLVKVGDILDLNTCRAGVLSAMEASNYEEAAMHVKRFLAINQQELRKTIHIISNDPLEQHDPKSPLFLDPEKAETTASSSKSDQDNGVSNIDENNVNLEQTDRALAELDETRGRLLHLCRVNLSQAIKEDNAKDIERFFKIFPMLNEHQEGLSMYAEYLRCKITIPEDTNDTTLDKTKQPKQNVQADRLASLFECIAKLIDHHQPLVETYCGHGHLIVIVRVIQRVCDQLSRKILEDFRNQTKLQQVAKLVRSSSLQSVQLGPNQTVNLQPSKLDPRTVDNILNEISLIITRSEVYLSFIVQRLNDDLNAKVDNETEREARHLELYNLIYIECELNHLIQEVGGIYVMLEQFYLNESAKKAILLDQIDVESSSCFISSMLDDIFFIIKKCTKRAISTKSTEVFCAIINHCTTLLESIFCQVLEERLRNQQYYSTAFTTKNLDLSQAYNAIQSGSRYLQSANELEVAKAQYFSALNNLDKACDYINTLRKILDIDIKKLRPSLLVSGQQRQDNQFEKSISCLNELTQLISRFSSIINSSLYQLFNALMRNRLRVELKTIISENPDLLPIVTESADEMTSLARSLLTTLDSSLEDTLTQENHSKLVAITRDFLASIINTVR